ncbi:8-oxo-dGTP diphosphatase [Spirochaeta cellobiosiphila]|uniref:8-oxo-dGTP diphosphatase n=1 Tax=Spirochaeta cellobiosiphila TaxID=504483 RepID=UPI00040EF749|nr:8-oxo-dGTP diphosphatase [Spirochaeta cellobiosiphila]
MIDWTKWIPKEQAVLCFIRQNDQLLLMIKKRGLGKGKVNAPGGRIEANETPVNAAIRECEEEVGLTPHNLLKYCHLSFDFKDGYSLFCYVYFADSFDGELIETEEADPFWCKIEDIPWDKMWEDDRHWLPELLKGNTLSCRFVFEEDRMLYKDIYNGYREESFLLDD